MSLRESLQTQAQRIKKGPPCSIGIIIEQLPEDDAEALQQAFHDPYVTGRAITAALRAEGYSARDYNVNRHRRGLCLCGEAL
jgi:hypothetical protein